MPSSSIAFHRPGHPCHGFDATFAQVFALSALGLLGQRAAVQFGFNVVGQSVQL